MPSNSSAKKASEELTAFKLLKSQLKFVDLVIEVADARAPLSSRHQKVHELFGEKPTIVVLAKVDLADKKLTNKWADRFRQEHNEVVLSLSLAGHESVQPLLKHILNKRADLAKQLSKKGLLERPIRVCVVGLPNVGKSTLINRLIGRRRLKAANRPGVTKGPQWVRVHPQIELLDTPGILPNFAVNERTTLKLTLLHLTAAQSKPVEEIAESGLELLREHYPNPVAEYLGEGLDLASLAQQRSFLTSGGHLDINRAASTFLADLRNGKLGPITLD